jgi:hypothetical protein
VFERGTHTKKWAPQIGESASASMLEKLAERVKNKLR